MSTSHHLIVGGAGAVGVSYAAALAKAGDSVSILVRDGHKGKFHRNSEGTSKYHSLYLRQLRLF